MTQDEIIRSPLEREKQASDVCIGYWNQKTGAFYKPMQVPAAFEKMLVEGILRKCYAAPVSIEAAVLAEREACAKVCEEVDVNNKGFPLNAKTYAAAIRARSK